MKKKTIALFIIMVLLVFAAMSLQASSQINQKKEKEVSEIIEEYVQELGNNWEQVASLFVKEKQNTYLNMLEQGAVDEHIGMFNIISATLIEKKEVAYKDVSTSFEFEENNGDVRTFVVGIDYEVYENTVFYSKGIAYTIMAFKREGDLWKIAAVSFIENPEELEEKGYKFTNNYKKCIRSMENRKRGILVDGDGKVFDKVLEYAEGQMIENDNEIEIIEKEVRSESKIGVNAKAAHTAYPFQLPKL